MKYKKQIRERRAKGPRDEAHVQYDRDAHTYNVVLEVDGVRVEFGALDIDHAEDLADTINASSWVQAHNEIGDS
jgi:hypothetical protein